MSPPPTNHDPVTRYLAVLDRHRSAILLVSALLCVLAAASVVRVELDANPLNMLPAGTPIFGDYRRLLARFGGQSTLVVLVDAPDAPTTQAFTEAYAQRLAASSAVATVRFDYAPLEFERDVLGRFLPAYISADDLATVRARLEPAAIGTWVAGLRTTLALPGTAGLQAFVRHDPLGLGRIALERLAPGEGERGASLRGGFFQSEDGQSALIFARPTREAFAVEFARSLLKNCRRIARTLRAERPEWSVVRVRFAGGHAHVLADVGAITRDMLVYTTLAPLAILAAFHFAYRNWAILPFVSFPVLFALLTSFGASQFLFERLDLAALAFSAIFYGLSIDAGIHFYTRFLQEAWGQPPVVAMARTLRGLGGALIVASTTTAAVFLVLGFSYVRGIAQLGILTAVGMITNVVAMFVLFPTLILATASRFEKTLRPPATLDTPRLGALTAWSGAQRRWMAPVAVFAAVGILAGRGVRIDTDFRRLRPTDSGPSVVEDEIERRFGIGEVDGTIVSEGPTTEVALQRAEVVAAILEPYRHEGLVLRIDSPAALIPSLATQRQRWQQWAVLPRAAAARALRDALGAAGFRIEAFADTLRLLENPEPAYIEPGPLDPPNSNRNVVPKADENEPTPPGGDTQPAALPAPLAPVSEMHLHHHDDLVFAATFIHTGGRLPALAARLRADLAAHGDPGWLSGRTLMEAELSRVLRREIWQFTALGLIANLAIVWTSFRSWRATAAVLLPPTAVLGLVLVGLRALDVALTPITVAVLPLFLGIGVDNCVYLAERHRHGASLGGIGTLGGRAVLMCSLTTIIGFGFLAFSRFPGLAQLGGLAATAIALGLVASLTLLPACLRAFRVPTVT